MQDENKLSASEIGAASPAPDESVARRSAPTVQNQSEDKNRRSFLLNSFFEFVAAIAFLTRVPVAKNLNLTARDVGRSTFFFPVVGAGIGVAQVAVLLLLQTAARDDAFRSILAAVLLAAVAVFATGALHLDGLADMADGFGGGATKERALEIMRDSLIGSYGATALVLLLLLKTTAIAALIFERKAPAMLILAPAAARWASVPLGKFMPYARSSGGLGQSITDFVGWRELAGASVFVAILIFLLPNPFGSAALWLIVIALTAFNAFLCKRKIGGVTGDTMGANTEICETAVFVAAVFLRV